MYSFVGHGVQPDAHLVEDRAELDHCDPGGQLCSKCSARPLSAMPVNSSDDPVATSWTRSGDVIVTYSACTTDAVRPLGTSGA